MTQPIVRLRAAARAARPLLAGQVIVVLAGALLRPALLWFLPPQEFATFGVLNETLRWGVVLGGAGLATGVLRFASAEPSGAGRLYRSAALITLAVSTAVVASILVADVTTLGGGGPATYFQLYGWRIPCVALTALAAAVLHAHGRLRDKALISSVDAVVVFAGALLGAYLDGLLGLVVGSLIGSLLVSTGASLHALRLTRNALAVRPRHVTRALAVGWTSVGFLLVETVRRVAVLRMAHLRGVEPADLGRLYAAMAFTLPLIALPEMIAQAVYPRLAGTDVGAVAIDRTHRRLLTEMAMVALPLLAAYGGLLWLVLPLIGDGEYAGALAPALVLLPGVAAHGLTALTGYVILIRDRLALAIGVSGLALGVATVGTYWLAPEWGALGAAAALSAALVVRGIALFALASLGRRGA